MSATRAELSSAYAQGEIDGKAFALHHPDHFSLQTVEVLTELYAHELEGRFPGAEVNHLQSQAYKIQLYNRLRQ